MQGQARRLREGYLVALSENYSGLGYFRTDITYRKGTLARVASSLFPGRYSGEPVVWDFLGKGLHVWVWLLDGKTGAWWPVDRIQVRRRYGH